MKVRGLIRRLHIPHPTLSPADNRPNIVRRQSQAREVCKEKLRSTNLVFTTICANGGGAFMRRMDADMT